MARSRSSELTAGIFVVLALGAGVGVLVWLGVVNLFAPKGQTVFFSVPLERGNLGLDIGSAVKVNDAWVGKVERIVLDLPGEQTLYETTVNLGDTTIRADARATAVAEFIGGASIVLENLGDAAGPVADRAHPVSLAPGPNAMIRQAQEALGFGEQQRQQFQAAIASVASASGEVEKIARALSQETDKTVPDALLVRVRNVAANLETTSADLQKLTRNLLDESDRNNAMSMLSSISSALNNVTSMTKNLLAESNAGNPDSLLAKVRSSADEINRMTTTAAAAVDRIAPAMEETALAVRDYTTKDVADILANLRQANTGLVEIIGDFKVASATMKDVVVLNRQSLDGMIADLKSTAANLNAAAKEIRRNPWRLLQQPGEKDVRTQNIYDAVRAFGEGAEQLDTAIARLESLRQARPEGVSADDPEVVKVRRHLQETFQRFRTVENALWDELSK